ncbi:membrane-associated protein, putative [Bodo saltans]|uniref:Membrane-associated protein, putative n=1 Tax=Bodo saltans TaxID=75058 RepID=A0A0S4JFW7_BODSA|nr:membrane-associated protein, putative [Bodo saltans]|eukprot:CUG89162.1 membrane-associated protein, putative [Bodo saltans]
MGFLVAPHSELFGNVLCTTVAAACSMVGSAWMLMTYRTYYPILHSPFNDMAAAVAVLQCLQALERLMVSVVALSTTNVPFLLCDVSGSIDQALGVSAEVLLSCFCLYLAVPQVRMRGVRWNVAYVTAVLVAVVSVTCCWVFLYDGAQQMSSNSLSTPRAPGCADALPFPPLTNGSDVAQMHFTLELGWCWLPSDACWYSGFSQVQLDVLRALCAYTTAVAYLVAAASALVSLACSSSCSGGGADGSDATIARVPRIVFLRLFLMAVFPMIALGFGAASRFSGDNHKDLDDASAVLLPLCGLWNAVVFLGTERMAFALMYRCPCATALCNDSISAEEGSYSELGSPTMTLPDGFTPPNGFTAAVRFLCCDLAIGEARERRHVFADVDTLLLRGSGDVRMPQMEGEVSPRRGKDTRRVLEL